MLEKGTNITWTRSSSNGNVCVTIKLFLSEIVIPGNEFDLAVFLDEIPDDAMFGSAVDSQHLMGITLAIDNGLLQQRRRKLLPAIVWIRADYKIIDSGIVTTDRQELWEARR